jgi:hypothetical protein
VKRALFNTDDPKMQLQLLPIEQQATRNDDFKLVRSGAKYRRHDEDGERVLPG